MVKFEGLNAATGAEPHFVQIGKFFHLPFVIILTR